MKQVRYKIYLTTGAILTVEMLTSDTTIGLSDIGKTMMEGMWCMFRLVDGATVCINPAHVTHVAAEEVEE